MGKFLHRYRKYDDFQKDYGTGPQVTAFTVLDAFVYQECLDDETAIETEEYNGRYVFDREIVVPSITDCNGQPFPFTNVRMRVFKKGDTEVVAMYLGDAWSYELGEASIIQDFQSAWQAGDVNLEVDTNSLEWGTPNYREPWVSYTTDRFVSKFTGHFSSGDHLGFEAEYAGECDWETMIE